MASSGTVAISRLGARADGVADTPEGPVFVPFALPGERWRLAKNAPPRRLGDSPERQTPLCRHFGTCGGCVAQHMSEQVYCAWKDGVVATAFAQRSIDAPVEPLRLVRAGSRRRAILGVKRQGSTVSVGFRAEGRHELVDVLECPVLDAAIVAVLAPLRQMARLTLADGIGGRVLVTRLDTGLDVAFEGGRLKLSPDRRTALAALAEQAGLIRLTVDGDVILMHGRPMVALGGVAVEPAPGAFLQAVPEAEAAMTEIVMGAVGARARGIADLFCGIGTFTFPLARRARVMSFDADQRAIAALLRAARETQGLKPIAARVRDLSREPLSAKELEPFDAAVLDPPRAGARAQAETLARSRVPVIVAVSCNPATLARDARTLIDGGYRLERVAPIDQFRFSAHIEAVAVFRR